MNTGFEQELFAGAHFLIPISAFSSVPVIVSLNRHGLCLYRHPLYTCLPYKKVGRCFAGTRV
ncbi:MAG: hypothetical protein JNL13_05535 [Chitinophagaceae bacterium]|nr:hypothetical protein [Chitinophagaceae bacterium]